MFYFLRTVFLFLILFVGLSLGIHWGASRYFHQEITEEGEFLPPLMPRTMFQVRDTASGLILAGMVAQNNRDWNHAWQSFAKLNDEFETDPQTALRAMTLALGNGDFNAVNTIANSLYATYLSKEDGLNSASEGFDLARLFLVVEAIKVNDFERAKKLNVELEGSILATFASPIVTAWLNAQDNSDLIDADAHGLADTQIVYKAMAAKFAGKDKVFENLKSKIKHPELVAMMEQNAPADIQSALAMAFHDLAKAMMVERAIDSALLFSQMAVYLKQELTFIYATIGDVLSYQQQDEEALEFYAKVKSDEDVYLPTIVKRVDILMDHDEFDSAIDVLDEAQNALKDENAELYYLKGNVYRANKDFEKALEAYDHAEVLGRQDSAELPQSLTPLYYSRAIVLDLLDRWEEAEKDLYIALDKFPNSPVILNYLGYAYADRNINLDKAKEMIEQAVIMAPNDAFIVDSMGWILYRMGDYGQATKYLERAASLNPYHMVINDHLGDAYWRLGRTREAHYMWQRALDYYDDQDEEQVRMIEDTKRKLNEGLVENNVVSSGQNPQ